MKKNKSAALLLALSVAAYMAFSACAQEKAAPSASKETEPAVQAAVLQTPVAPSYFDDAVFVGDSITSKLQMYAQDLRQNGEECLGQAQFITSGSLGYNNALWEISEESVHPFYKGAKTKIEDAVQDCGAKKVYLMLGMNDLGLFKDEQTFASIATLLESIKEKVPDVQLFLQSVTPMLKESQQAGLNNARIEEFDQKLKAYCEDNGYSFIDVASVMRDAQGNLIPEYCGDPDVLGIHFTSAACNVWVDYLLNHPR